MKLICDKLYYTNFMRLTGFIPETRHINIRHFVLRYAADVSPFKLSTRIPFECITNTFYSPLPRNKSLEVTVYENLYIYILNSFQKETDALDK